MSSITAALNVFYFSASNIWSTKFRSMNGFEGKILEFTYGKTMNLHADSSDVKDYENIRDLFRQSPTVPLESIVPTLPTSPPAQQIQHRLQHSYKENYNATL